MKRKEWSLYAVALAPLLVGLSALGIPASTLVLGALVLACPLMMLFMHGGGHGRHNHAASDHTAEPGDAPQASDNEIVGRR